MGLTMKERKAITKGLAEQYRRSRKAQKGILLNSFIEATGYNRSYAAGLLRSHGRKLFLSHKVVLVGDVHQKEKGPSGRKPIYDNAVRQGLILVWEVLDYLCGRRLVPILPEALQNLKRHRQIKLSAVVEKKLCQMSVATADRLLSEERKKYQLKKGRSHTKPGTLLKHQVPIRTFADWNEKRPGFVEIDLVGHDGGNASGDFGYTLDATDVQTTWTETEAVRNKAQAWVFEAMKRIRERFPFDLLGIDSDNGSEFINSHFVRYCQAEQITFTRGRPYKKNDGCFVEQKNYSVVRRAVGYARYDSEGQIDLLNALYRSLRLYTNYFQPTMKLIEKVRIGSRVTKRYDVPKTPYQRVLDSQEVGKGQKEALRLEYQKLNLAQLKQEIERIQKALERSVATQRRLSVPKTKVDRLGLVVRGDR
jgi:hypothetical protein